jgi:hypothetical protein
VRMYALVTTYMSTGGGLAEAYRSVYMRTRERYPRTSLQRSRLAGPPRVCVCVSVHAVCCRRSPTCTRPCLPPAACSARPHTRQCGLARTDRPSDRGARCTGVAVEGAALVWLGKQNLDGQAYTFERPRGTPPRRQHVHTDLTRLCAAPVCVRLRQPRAACAQDGGRGACLDVDVGVAHAVEEAHARRSNGVLVRHLQRQPKPPSWVPQTHTHRSAPK